MTDVSHTPGHWVVDGPAQMEITGDVFRVHDSGRFPMAFVPAWNEPDRSEAEANARLIAAAPDGLEIAEEFLAFAYGGNVFSYPPGSLQKLEQFIAKARGQA